MIDKLLQIYKNSGKDAYVKVRLKDGRSINCKADCFTSIGDEEDEDRDIEALSIIQENGSREIIIEDDIEKVYI